MRKKREKQSEAPPTVQGPRTLQSYHDYILLMQDTINGVFDKSIDPKQANTIGVLTGYALNALKYSAGGQMKMNIFLQDMKRVNVSMLSPEDMDRFLQGDETTQIEVLKALEDKGGIVEAEVSVTPKIEVKPKLDVPMLAEVTGLAPDAVQDALSGEGEKPIMNTRKHQWERSIGGSMRFCMECGAERVLLQPEDMTSACSGTWGL